MTSNSIGNIGCSGTLIIIGCLALAEWLNRRPTTRYWAYSLR